MILPLGGEGRGEKSQLIIPRVGKLSTKKELASLKLLWMLELGIWVMLY